MGPACTAILAYAALSAAASGAPAERVEFAQLTIRQSVVVRVPTRPGPPPIDKRIKWKESKGPKCVPVTALRGAAITGEDRVDLFLKGGPRLRAKLDGDCRALDFYSGFYVRPHADGRVCADRDMILARGGGKCVIERFRLLRPEK